MLYLVELIENVAVVRQIFDADMLDIADDALLVDEENDAIAVVGLGQDAVIAADFTVGRAVGEQVVGDTADCFLPVLEARDRIDRNGQDLCVMLFKMRVFVFIGWNLVGADGCPGHREKSEQDVIFALEVGQPDFSSQMRRESKVGSFAPDLQFFWILFKRKRHGYQSSILANLSLGAPHTGQTSGGSSPSWTYPQTSHTHFIVKSSSISIFHRRGAVG